MCGQVMRSIGGVTATCGFSYEAAAPPAQCGYRAGQACRGADPESWTTLRPAEHRACNNEAHLGVGRLHAGGCQRGYGVVLAEQAQRGLEEIVLGGAHVLGAGAVLLVLVLPAHVRQTSGGMGR